MFLITVALFMGLVKQTTGFYGLEKLRCNKNLCEERNDHLPFQDAEGCTDLRTMMLATASQSHVHTRGSHADCLLLPHGNL